MTVANLTITAFDFSRAWFCARRAIHKKSLGPTLNLWLNAAYLAAFSQTLEKSRIFTSLQKIHACVVVHLSLGAVVSCTK